MLTHLLAPTRCNVVTVVTVFVTVSGSVVSDKFSGTLVHGASVGHVSCGAIFFFGLIINIVLCILLCFYTPSVDSFFGRPVLVPIAEIVNLILVVGSLNVVRHAVVIQRVSFEARAGVSLVTSLSDNKVNVIVTFCNCNI